MNIRGPQNRWNPVTNAANLASRKGLGSLELDRIIRPTIIQHSSSRKM